MLEFVLGEDATVMLREQDVDHGGIYQITGWSLERGRDGIISVNNSESHAKTTRGIHQVFTGSKPLPNVKTVKNILHKEGII